MKETGINNFILQLTKFNRPSISLMVMPYLILSFRDLYNSIYFSFFQFGIILLLLVLFDFLIKPAVQFETALSRFFLALTITLLFLFFYGEAVVYQTVVCLNRIFDNVIIRGRRVIILYFIIILVVVFFLTKKQAIFYKPFNYFFLILSTITLINSLWYKTENELTDLKNLKSNPLEFIKKSNIKKPVILIIADELASPNELYKLNKDSSFYDFSNNLQKQGWIVKNSFFSYELSTIHSLSSLFNFNLSTSKDYNNKSVYSIGAQKLMHCDLYDSLKKKNVSVCNFGIFDFGESKPFTSLYFYPKNFTNQFLSKSVFPSIVYNTGELKMGGFNNSYYPMDGHNNNVIHFLNDSLQNVKTLSCFAYVHLWMPHFPFEFGDEFLFKKKVTNNYIEFWRFTTIKLMELINKLTVANRYKIILSGDHGYRADSRINAHETASFFWGFDPEEIKKLKSVQDFGLLSSI